MLNGLRVANIQKKGENKLSPFMFSQRKPFRLLNATWLGGNKAEGFFADYILLCSESKIADSLILVLSLKVK